ncbi:hypothetical protein J6590_024228 [Homalodisca vitripennis]|nr:hypothetical protein J6590_024228 [Homalodisca vitripennis]
MAPIFTLEARPHPCSCLINRGIGKCPYCPSGLTVLTVVRSLSELDLGTNGLKVTSDYHQWLGRRAVCKDRIAHRSTIQAAATLDCLIRLPCDNRCTHYTTIGGGVIC